MTITDTDAAFEFILEVSLSLSKRFNRLFSRFNSDSIVYQTDSDCIYLFPITISNRVPIIFFKDMEQV